MTRRAILLTTLLLCSLERVRGQYTPFHHDPKLLLEGHWQSCADERTGQFDEKIFDQPALGLEVHLGPGDEFAIFRGIQDEHRDHRSPDNLLQPYRVRSATQRWELPDLIFDVAHAGGSRRDCRSFWITLQARKQGVDRSAPNADARRDLSPNAGAPE